MQFNKFYYIGLIIVGFQMFFIQIQKLIIDNSQNCLKIFKSNNLLGLIVLLLLLLGKILS